MSATKKWADFIITKKRMNKKGTHIDQVWVQSDIGPVSALGHSVARKAVVVDLNNGVTFVTAYLGDDGGLKKGETVIVDPVNGIDYIKTLPDKTEKDNLDNLPDY